MGESDLVEAGSDHRRGRRDAAWVLLVGLLVGLFAFSGGTGAEAQESPPAACADGTPGEQVTLPSGETHTFCSEARADGATADAGASIVLAKTVGTSAATCAPTDVLNVVSGTEVFYCYRVQNTGGVTVSVHDLEDDKLGTLLDGFSYDLGPGASTFLTASATIEDDTVNVATWTSSNGTDTVSSADSALVTVIQEGAPGAPTSVVATASEGKVDLTWTAPVEPGGSPITGYIVTPYVGEIPGTPTTVSTPTTSASIDGLVNGTTYTFKVAAVNAIDNGPQSAASNAVTPQWWLPWTSGTVAVNELFTWMTGKAPTSAERTSWLSQLNAGTKKPGDLVAALRVGPDATANVDPTVRLYSAYLVRIPDVSGLNFWLGRRRAGWTLSRISSNFAASSEFKTRYGDLTNREFVEQIYLNVLERTGEASGVNYWTNQLNTRKKSRGQVMINFSESNEYKNKQVDRVDAAVVYIHVLGRRPTVAERDAFASALAGGTPLATLVRQIIHLPSFPARAG